MNSLEFKKLKLSQMSNSITITGSLTASTGLYSSITTATSGSYLINSSGVNIGYYDTIKSDFDYFTDYVDMIAKISGIPINFDKFKEMSEGEIDAFIRLQKIKKIEE